MGMQFVSECVKEVSRLLGICQLTTIPYHPMCSDGLVEKFNGTLKSMLKRSCNGIGTQMLCYSHTKRCLRSQWDLCHLSCYFNTV